VFSVVEFGVGVDRKRGVNSVYLARHEVRKSHLLRYRIVVPFVVVARHPRSDPGVNPGLPLPTQRYIDLSLYQALFVIRAGGPELFVDVDAGVAGIGAGAAGGRQPADPIATTVSKMKRIFFTGSPPEPEDALLPPVSSRKGLYDQRQAELPVEFVRADVVTGAAGPWVAIDVGCHVCPHAGVDGRGAGPDVIVVLRRGYEVRGTVHRGGSPEAIVVVSPEKGVIDQHHTDGIRAGDGQCVADEHIVDQGCSHVVPDGNPRAVVHHRVVGHRDHRQVPVAPNTYPPACVGPISGQDVVAQGCKRGKSDVDRHSTSDARRVGDDEVGIDG